MRNQFAGVVMWVGAGVLSLWLGAGAAAAYEEVAVTDGAFRIDA